MKFDCMDGWRVLKPVKAKKVSDGGIHLPDSTQDSSPIYFGKDDEGTFGYVQGREFSYGPEVYHAVETKHIVFELKGSK